ncbi:hypothetical protein [Mucilaginibacter sp.]|uniref:hypothetical protein n=1 Tax=Mucilaginibacter sp. TaxID=1882438 RepID=UPI0035BC332A
MNKIPLSKKVQIVECLVNGMSLKDTSILADVSINTVTKLQMDLGKACLAYHENTVKSLVMTKEVACQFIWSFANLGSQEEPAIANGTADDYWTWVAQDNKNQLIITFSVSPCNIESAMAILKDVRLRVVANYEVATIGPASFTEAAKESISDGIENQLSFSALKDKLPGIPELRHGQTETSLAAGLQKVSENVNGFSYLNKMSKKVMSLWYSLSLHCVYHNFCREQAGGATPAMRAGLTTKLMSIEDLIALK